MAKTSIYFAPYHSQPGAFVRGSTGQFLVVEQAIEAGEWPYDNGDDPSFYAARHGGLLTWGVCRQNVRNAPTMVPGTIVVFFGYTREGDKVLYRMSAVATVAEKLDRRAVFSDPRFTADEYSNLLIRPENGGWRYDEGDRPPRQDARHAGDWLWRVAVHGRRQEQFNRQNEHIYDDGWFADGEVPIAHNYIVFSESRDDTFISRKPPYVAAAVIRKGVGASEHWSNLELRELTVNLAQRYRGRGCLRTTNRSGRNVHPTVHFTMPIDDAGKWRKRVITALRRHSRN